MSLFKCPGATKILQPYPEDIKCASCGAYVEIWSDEVETKCDACGEWVIRELPLDCLEWCDAAEECVGPERWKRYRKIIEARKKRLKN